MNPVIELKRRLKDRSQVALAKELGVSPQYLSDVLNDRREPGRKLLGALGLARRITWTRVDGVGDGQ